MPVRWFQLWKKISTRDVSELEELEDNSLGLQLLAEGVDPQVE